MKAAVLAVTAVSLCLLAAACGGSSSSAPGTGPTPSAGFAGQWTGTTGQGQPLTFTVSSDEKVTAISVGYSFNGCSGAHESSNLSLEIKPQVICIPAPCPPAVTSSRLLNYDDGNPFQGQYTSVNGVLVEALGLFTGEGSVTFRNYPSCGTTRTSWTARRR